MLSPFIQTFHLPTDVEGFMRSQGGRRHFASAIWPRLERAMIHLDRKQFDFFERELRDFGYDQPLTAGREREAALVWACNHYGMVFCAPNFAPFELIESRIERAERLAPAALADVVAYFKSKQRNASIDVELVGIRRQWVRLMFLLPIYNVFYWDSSKHSLDEFTIGQKRFDELKPFYVDCFETLSRISAIAAAVEGAIQNSVANVPTKKGMSIAEFEVMANGSKPGVLKNLAVADLFVPFMDHHLRNGMGHNAARYNVVTDVVHYANENGKAKTEYQMPYVRFCEKVVRMYGQLEIVARYASWLRLQCA